MNLHNNRGFIIKKIFLIILLIYTFMLIPLAQLQMSFFNKVVINDAEYKIIIILCIILYIVYKQTMKIYKVDILFFIYSILVSYIICDAFLNAIFNNFSISYIVDIIGRAYTPFIIGYFFCFINLDINIDKIFKIIIGFSLLNLIIAYIQKFNNNILFKYRYDQHGNQIFNSIEFGENNFRCVGITSSGYNLGIILVFLITISLVAVLFSKKNFLGIKKKVFIILIPFSIIGIMFTQTRNVYFFSLYIILYIMLYKLFKKLRTFLKYIYPIITPILYWKLLNLFALGKNINSDIVGNANTFLIRINIFNENISLLKNSSVWKRIFGGFIVEIDNIFLYWINTIGIIGTILIISFIIVLYVKLVKVKKLDSITLILSSYLSSLFFIGLLNLLPFEYCFFAIILSTIWIRKREDYIKNQF